MDPVASRPQLLPGGTLRDLDVQGTRTPMVVRPRAHAGRTLFLLPPLGEGWSTWVRVWRALGELGSCVAFGPPEPADSPRGAAPPGVLATVSALLRVLEEPAGEPAILVGASMGGLAALRAAREAPARVGGVICVALRPDVGSLSYLEPLFDVRTTGDMARLLAMMRFDAPSLSELSLTRLMEPLQSAAFRRSLRGAASMNVRHEAEQAVKLDIPLTFIYGAADGLLAAGAVTGLAPLPGVRVHCLDACGHYPQQERWEECARLISAAVGTRS
jgi:pimeloyl-ACP methyl ester carboxylesterase